MAPVRALQYDAYGEPPHLLDVPDPVCPPDGVVVAVRATGVCRSDWHAWQGHDPVPLPMVPGHELAGVVVEVGPHVTGHTIGERVTVPFVCGCGRCTYCADGDAQVCPDQQQPGFTMPGSFADLVALPSADLNLVTLPDAIGFVAAASLGCRFATAYRALTAHGQVAPGQHVVAVDLSPAALDLARGLGADALVAAGPAAVRHIREATGGGAHVSLDAVGTSATAVASVESLRPRGRHVQVGLLLGAHATPPLPMGRVVAQELSIHGSHGMAARDYPAMLDLVASGAVDPLRLVGRTIPLEDAGAALAAMSTPNATAGMTVVELA